MMRFLLILLTCGAAVAADRYLDAAATGANNGTSWTDAWTDVSSASGISAGDTLWIRQGTYGALSLNNKANVTVKIDPDATGQAIFTGHFSDIGNMDNFLMDGLVGTNIFLRFKGRDYASQGSVLSIKFCQGITLRGIEVEREDLYEADTGIYNGINFNNSSTPANEDVLVEDSYVHHIGGDGINVNSPGTGTGYDGYIFRRLHISNTYDDAIQTVSRSTIYDCYFDRGSEPAKWGGHQDAIQTAIGASYIKIYNNIARDYSQNFFIEDAQGYVRFYNNVMIGGQVTGSQRGLSTAVMADFEGEYWLCNNTFYNFLTFHAISGGQNIISSGADFRYGGNIFVNCKYVGSEDIATGADNIYWDEAGVQYYDTSGNPVSVPSNRVAGDAVYVDPLFTDPANGDFTLQSGSPAIGSGTDFSELFTTDLLGNTRTTWDMGAYAFTGETENSAPMFLSHPESQAVQVGASVTLTALATGVPSPTYQWFKDAAEIVGATSSSYSIASVAEGDAGEYYVVATNSEGSAQSNPATLTVSVEAPPSNPAGGVMIFGGRRR